MDKKKILVCSAWPYASGVPHLGNLVSSLLSGDVFSRYYRLKGHDVLYVSGTDAHGTRIEFEAERLGISPKELSEKHHEQIVDVIKAFGIEFDNYTSTETAHHAEFVRKIYLDMQKGGFISNAEERRAFCRNCEVFLADRFISGTCPKCSSNEAMGNQCDNCGAILEPEELIEPTCVRCGGKEIEFRLTRHWYLDLPKLSDALRKYVARQDFQGNVGQFTKQMINDGLRARAMTRDIEWGIPAPFEGAEGKVIYVWGEAALGYVSATIEHFDGGDEWKDYWFGDNVHQIYTIGKDNIPFHTLIFPGQLLASGAGYHLPDQIAATEYLNWIEGRSFSKSRGVGLYCDEALEVMDADLWRFYLLYNRPEERDVNFSWEELGKAINGVLISNVANLVNRVLSFVQTKYECRVPDEEIDDEITEEVHKACKKYTAAVQGGQLSKALQSTCSLAVVGNEYFQRKEPWATGNSVAVASAFWLVRAMTVMLIPFVPEFAGSVLDTMTVDDVDWSVIDQPVGGQVIKDQRVLLEQIDIEKIKENYVSSSDGDLSSVADLEKLDIRVAEILSAKDIDGADKLYKLKMDIGDREVSCVAGIKGEYSIDELVGRKTVVVTNLEPATICGIESECMILAASGATVSLLAPDRDVEPGTDIR